MLVYGPRTAFSSMVEATAGDIPASRLPICLSGRILQLQSGGSSRGLWTRWRAPSRRQCVFCSRLVSVIGDGRGCLPAIARGSAAINTSWGTAPVAMYATTPCSAPAALRLRRSGPVEPGSMPRRDRRSRRSSRSSTWRHRSNQRPPWQRRRHRHRRRGRRLRACRRATALPRCR